MVEKTCVELFAGTASFSKAWRELGGLSFTIELNPDHNPDLVADISELSVFDIPEKFRRPDVVWASPPCTSFSVAALWHNWNDGYPVSDKAEQGVNLLMHTFRLINLLKPRYWFVENPVGMMRALPIMELLPSRKVTYCQYGDFRMKPTDIWTNCSHWFPKSACSPGAACHEAARRGANGGTQGQAGNKERSVIPHELMLEVASAAMGDRSRQEVLSLR